MGSAPPIAFLDLGATYRELQPDLDAAWRRVMAGGWYVLGSEVSAFEEEFANYCGANHVVGVGTGLDALVLALKALGVGSGDEVLVPSNTFIATWLAVSAIGASPVPVEPSADTHLVDAEALEAAVTDRTRAVIPVHLYGQPVDMGPILSFARRHDCRVIADAAQAHGAYYAGSPIGALGDAVCWSFYPGKNLGAFGDGGAVSTDSPEIAERIAMLRNYGSQEKYVHELRGTNTRLDEVQAALLRVKLRHLDEWNARRSRIADSYTQGLHGLDGITCPAVAASAEPVWHLYVIRCAHRDRVQRSLAGAGIQSHIHYPVPPHRQPAFRDLTGLPALPDTEQLCKEVLSLPIGPHLEAEAVERVIEAVSAAV